MSEHQHEWKNIWQDGDGPVVIGCECGVTKGYTEVRFAVIHRGALIVTDGKKIVKHGADGIEDITGGFH